MYLRITKTAEIECVEYEIVDTDRCCYANCKNNQQTVSFVLSNKEESDRTSKQLRSREWLRNDQ